MTTGNVGAGERAHLRVACAVLERDGRIFAARRGAAMSMSGKWEFPGGKIRPGETPEGCLRRELREELGIEVRVLGAMTPAVHDYPAFTITLYPLRCAPASGTLVLHEHAEGAWLTPAELPALDWAEADLPIVATLCGAP